MTAPATRDLPQRANSPSQPPAIPFRFTGFPIRFKVVAASSSLVLVITVFIFLFYPARQERASIAAMKNHAEQAASMVALGVGLGLERNDFTMIADAVGWAKQDSALAYLAAVDTAGDVFASYNPRHLRVDVAAAARAGMSESDGLLKTSVPVAFQGRKLGALVLGLSLDAMNRQIASDRRTALAVCGVLVVLGTLASFVFASHITKPIVLLRNAADRMAGGDYDVMVAVGSHDEVGALSEAFGIMSQRVRDAVSSLASQANDLANARDAALAASRAKADFLAVMSHEIRTPMNGVVGLTNLLADTPLNAEQRQYVEAASHSAQSLMSVINDILDFSKVEAGKLAIEPIPFDLGAVVAAVADMLGPRAAEHGIELVVRYAPTAPSRVIGDPGRLRQILLNLAGNAVKFTSKGFVLISVDGKGSNGSALLRFDVTDTGIGISGEQLARLFQPFMQADVGTTRKFGGTGLGLSISKQLVELMGGAVTVRSEPGVGSTFSFSLSLPEDESPVEAAAPRASLTGLRALIVDDMAINVQVCREWLRSWGMQVDEAANGRDGLALLRQASLDGDPIRIAIVDYLMPLMDGETFGRAVRADALIDRTWMVLATSAAQRGDAERFRSAGFDAYLVKPFPSDTLRTAMELLLARKEERSVDEPILTRHMVAERATALRRISGAGTSGTSSSGGAPANTPDEAGESPQPAGRRVLLVEDNPVNQLVAVAMLKKLGCTADIAADGIEALEMTQRSVYDVVFMDMQMPRLDGLEATRRIRAREEGRSRMYIVAMTANAMEGDREICLAAGMDGYITKPISLAVLQRALDELPVVT